MADGGWTEKLIPTLYEDEHLLAVSKPAGIDATADRTGRAPGVAEMYALCRSVDRPLLVAKRLTRDESGVLVLCKSEAAARGIREQLKARQVTQEYIAIVRGTMKQRRLVIDETHGASRGRPSKGATARRAKPAAGEQRTAKSAQSRSTVLTLLEGGQRRSMVRCRTTLDTTHALRAQMRAVKLRIIGDRVNDRSFAAKKQQTMHLHLASISLKHPITGRPLKIDSPQPKQFDSALHGKEDIARVCVASVLRRLQLLGERQTTSYRLLTGDSEGIRGVNVERYGEVIVIQVTDDRAADRDTVLDIAKWYRRAFRVSAVYVKSYVRKRTGAGTNLQNELHDAAPLLGLPVKPEFTVHESGLHFAIRPYDGFSVGLFPDHRENRRRIRALSQGKDVLNLFSYTGSFSVAAAVGGAASVTSVDIAKKCLEWSRRNFSLNGLDPGAYSFVCEDARTFLARAKRRGDLWDLVVLDPPTFAHGKGKRRSFSVAEDLTDTLTAAIDVLRPNGTLMVSSNYRKFSIKELQGKIRQAARPRKARITETPPLPIDFAVDADHAKTLFANIE